ARQLRTGPSPARHCLRRRGGPRRAAPPRDRRVAVGTIRVEVIRPNPLRPPPCKGEERAERRPEVAARAGGGLSTGDEILEAHVSRARRPPQNASRRPDR